MRRNKQTDPLSLDPETMRTLGYQVVDWLVDREQRRSSEPVLQQASPAEMAARISGTPPYDGVELDSLLEDLSQSVLPFRSRIDDPRYLAYVPGSGTWPGVLGDLIASAFNIDAGNWMESAGPSQLELTVLRWFARWIGYPDSASGVLVSGGSAANLTALACAREALVGAMRDDLVVYICDQGHSSLARAARVLGFRPEQVRVLPTDESFRMRISALEGAVRADLAAGRRPLAVLAVAGTTNTGAVDPLPEIARLCRSHGVWLHVDAAYGGFAVLTERGRRALEGIEEADSVTLDPHKWLYQPFECGALLVRDDDHLHQAFEIHPDYLQDTTSTRQEVNFAERGLQLTRASRAIKVWISLRYFGLPAFVTAVDRCLDLAERTREYVEASDELELMAPPALGIVCFRRHPKGMDDDRHLEHLNTQLVAELAESGHGMLSSTRLQGRFAIRACILNHGTRWEHIEQILNWVSDTTVGADEAEPMRQSHRTATVAAGWPFPAPSLLDRLRTLPLLADVDDTWVTWVATVSGRRQVRAGDDVVRQWDIDRDFYLVLDGQAEVYAADQLLTTMDAGDFFGELAALDWGASFGYPRLATVTARTDLDLLTLTDANLAELIAEVPAVDARVRAAIATRLRRG